MQINIQFNNKNKPPVIVSCRNLLLAFLYTLPGFYFLLIQFIDKKFGKTIFILNQNGDLSWFGQGLFYIFLVVSFILSIWGQVKEQLIPNRICKNPEGVCSRQILNYYLKHNEDELRFFVNQIRNYQPGAKIETILDTRQQTDNYLKNMGNCLEKIFKSLNPNIKDIIISVVYEINNNWRVLGAYKADTDPTIKKLVSNPESTLYHVINSEVDIFQSKKSLEGQTPKKYFKSPRDMLDAEQGSIICMQIGVNDLDNIDIRGILSISTFGGVICEDTDDKNREFIRGLINQFLDKIRIEMIYALIQHLVKNNKITIES
ncbi:MAG: hypothetical protein ACM3X6_07835 [Patescibacteria group bacterium]